MATDTRTQTIAVLRLRGKENPLDNEKTPIIEAMGERFSTQKYDDDDWRKKLVEDGYVIIKNAFPKERALEYAQRAEDHLKSFGTDLDFEDKSTWTAENLPDQSRINTFTLHCIPHEKFMWDIRQDKDIRKHFEKLWGTEKLLVSFDALNVSLPGRKDSIAPAFWPHFDQSPYRYGLVCVQGIASLSHSGPKDGGLVVYKGSHNLFRQFFDEKCDRNDKKKWGTLDSIDLTKDEIQWFLDNGCEEIKTECEPGDLILWDSRTIHYGQSPQPDSEQIRTIAYVCYTPAEFATENDLDMKARAFRNYETTTHWPHTNIISEFEPFPYSGNIEVRTEPLVKPDYNDQDLLKLAGAIHY